MCSKWRLPNSLLVTSMEAAIQNAYSEILYDDKSLKVLRVCSDSGYITC